MCGRWTMSFRTTRLQKILSNIPYQFKTLPKYPQTHTMHPFAYTTARWLAYRIPHRIPLSAYHVPNPTSPNLEISTCGTWKPSFCTTNLQNTGSQNSSSNHPYQLRNHPKHPQAHCTCVCMQRRPVAWVLHFPSPGFLPMLSSHPPPILHS